MKRSSILLRYSIVQPKTKKDSIFGVGKSDNYSGLIGILHREEADIALASVIPTEERGKVVDFAVSLDYFRRVLCYRDGADKQGLSWTTYISGFHSTTWIALLTTTILSSLVFWIILWREPKLGQEKNKRSNNLLRNDPVLPCVQQPQDEHQTFGDALFMHLGCLMQQGHHTTPNSGRLRFLFCSFWFASLCLYAYYTATLTSSLTVRVRKLPFNNLQEAAENNDWEIGLVKGTPTLGLIQSIGKTWSDSLSAKIEGNPSLEVTNEQEGLLLAKESNSAFIFDDATITYLLSGDCSIQCLYLDGYDAFGYIPYRKAFHSQGVIDQKLFLLKSGGLIHRMKKDWKPSFYRGLRVVSSPQRAPCHRVLSPSRLLCRLPMKIFETLGFSVIRNTTDEVSKNCSTFVHGSQTSQDNKCNEHVIAFSA
ncbi:Ionotropic glutamate receptor [Trinorchestia longiramus]|nr:Ionotropic glutamate receptor [Trinorchestia longiramus]